MFRALTRAGLWFGFMFSLVAGPLSAGTVAHWRFDESGGDTAYDSVGSHDGALAGSAALGVAGVSGGAVSLSRDTGDHVDMGAIFDFTSGDFSISVWVKTTTEDAESVVVGKHRSGVVAGYFLCVNTTGGYGDAGRVFFYQSPSSAENPVSTTTVNDGSWHHVVAVYTAGGTAEIFVDGTPAEDSGTSSPVGATSAVFMVGGITYGDSPTGLFSGLVDDLQVYDHALSGEEIGFLFAHPGVSIADHVFSDDFESGGTTSWSGSAGE